MPAYLVEMPVQTGLTLHGHHGANKMVIFASNAADALAAAEGHFPGTAGWISLATANEIVAGTDLAGYTFIVNITGGAAQTVDPISVSVSGGAGNNALNEGAQVVNAGGTGYATDDILTVVGGTFTRAATLRVTGQTAGVIDSVETVDPGEYTVNPTLVANAVTGGTGSSATIDLTMAGANSYEVFLGQLITRLNAQADIANAAVDMSEGAAGTRLLTLASIADGIGDATVTLAWGKEGGNVAGLSSTITHEGVAAAVLTVALPTIATLVLPSAVTPVSG